MNGRQFSTKSSTASRRLYRILQRQCMDLKAGVPSHPSDETMFLIQPSLNPLQHGSYRLLPVKTVSEEDSVRHLLVFFRDWNEDNGKKMLTNGLTLSSSSWKIMTLKGTIRWRNIWNLPTNQPCGRPSLPFKMPFGMLFEMPRTTWWKIPHIGFE